MRFEYESQEAVECPLCGYEYLHQEQTEVYERGEDAVETQVTVVRYNEVSHKITPSSECANPSRRRDGLTITLRCEGCGKVSKLAVYQHKGCTYVEWV